MDTVDRFVLNIRKITTGLDPKNGMTYQVGTFHNSGQYVIKGIILSEYDNAIFNKRIVQVFISRKESEKTFLWKDFDNIPMVIEYDIPNEN